MTKLALMKRIFFITQCGAEWYSAKFILLHSANPVRLFKIKFHFAEYHSASQLLQIFLFFFLPFSINAQSFPPKIDSLLNLARTARTNDQALIASGYYEKARRQLKISNQNQVSPTEHFAFFEEAFSLIDENLPLAKTQLERQSYLRAEYPFLEDGLEFCWSQVTVTPKGNRYFEEAFQIIEKSKSLINFFPNSDLQQIFQLENVPKELISKKAELNAEMLALTDSLRNLKNDGQKNRLQSLRNELAELNTNFEKNYPNYFQFSEFNKIEKLENVEQVLKSNEAVLEYFLGKEDVYLLVISKEEKAILKLIDSKSANEILEDFLINLREPARYKKMVSVGHQVYQIFIEPALKNLKNIGKITVIPDGQLGAIPFEAALKSLPKKLNYDFKKLDYLIHHFQFAYHNSTTQLIRQRQNSKLIKDPKIAAFAPVFDSKFHQYFQQHPKYLKDSHYLAATQDSLISLGKNLGWLASEFDALIYKNEKATINNFKQHFEADILHFGTHILFDAKYPMQSNIVFSKSINENNQLTKGFLSLHELQTFQLNGNLAILAGCESGRGKFRRAAGINSLAYGFNLAGIPSTFYSLWKVNERESAALIQLFYQNLKDGLPKDEALHRAKISYLNAAKDFKAAPAFWAAFVVNGDVSGFEFSGSFDWIWLILFGIVFFLFIKFKVTSSTQKKESS